MNVFKLTTQSTDGGCKEWNCISYELECGFLILNLEDKRSICINISQLVSFVVSGKTELEAAR